MNPIVTAVVTGAIVVVGKWSKGKAPNIDNAVGVAGIAIILSLIEQADEKLASLFAWLVLLGVSIVYIPDIVKAAGFGSK